MKLRNVWLIIWTIFGFQQIKAATYYFSSSIGDDNRTALEAQNPNTPWQTLDKLNAVFLTAQPGDIFLLKSGDVFFGNLLLDRDGLPNAPFRIASYGVGETPIISGFSSLQNGVNQGGGIYKFSLPVSMTELNMVRINGVNYPMGRWPNAGEGYLNYESSTYSSINDPELPATRQWGGKYFQQHGSFLWDNRRRHC